MKTRRMKKIEIDGNKFSNMIEFYDEIEKKFTKDLNWKIGRNLNAFNDVLRGGFGIHVYKEKIEVIWSNSEISKSQLGIEETVKYLEQVLESYHPSNSKDAKEELKLARIGKGEILFELIVRIIKEHEHIKLKTYSKYVNLIKNYK